VSAPNDEKPIFENRIPRGTGPDFSPQRLDKAVLVLVVDEDGDSDIVTRLARDSTLDLLRAAMVYVENGMGP
jgi:hypothetical protein